MSSRASLTAGTSIESWSRAPSKKHLNLKGAPRNLVCTRLPFDSRPPSVPDESLAVLIRGHEIAPGTQTDDRRHGAIINIGRTCWQVGSPCTRRRLRFAYRASGAVDQDLGDGRARPAESRSACAGAREATVTRQIANRSWASDKLRACAPNPLDRPILLHVDVNSSAHRLASREVVDFPGGLLRWKSP